MQHEQHSQPTLDELKRRRREAAERVRYILHELEAAEREFNRATQALREAFGKDYDAA